MPLTDINEEEFLGSRGGRRWRADPLHIENDRGPHRPYTVVNLAPLRARKASKFRPCHANADCSRLGRGPQYACGPIPSEASSCPTARAEDCS